MLSAPLPHPAETYRLQHRETIATIARQGAAVVGLAMGGRDVLVTTPIDDERTDTTHTMQPFSVTWTGPQHGNSRRMRYEPTGQTAHSLTMEATDPVTGLQHEQMVEVDEDRLTIIDTVTNPAENADEATAWGTSLGKHPYFAVGRDHAPDFQIRTTRGDGLLTAVRSNGERITGTWQAFWEYIDDGETLLCHDITSPLRLTLPGERPMELEMKVTGYVAGRRQPVTIALWSRGNGTVCVEPVIGAARDEQGKLLTDLLRIGPEESAVLTTTFTKLTRPDETK